MLDDIGRRGDGRVIVRGIETCHGWWQRRLFDDLLNCFAMFCFVLSSEYHCNLQYFSKPRDTFLSGRRLALPRLASPGLALSCLVMPCLVLPGFECDAFSSNIKKMVFIWWGCFNVFFALFTIWLITVDNRMGKYRYFLICWAKTSFYKRYLLMAWYLVYPMILGHFQITRLMPGKYGGHSADDILKLISFCKKCCIAIPMEIVPLAVGWPSYSRYQITHQGNGIALGMLAIIINPHSWFVF